MARLVARLDTAAHELYRRPAAPQYAREDPLTGVITFFAPEAERTLQINAAITTGRLFVRDEAPYLDDATLATRCDELIRALDDAETLDTPPPPPRPAPTFVVERGAPVPPRVSTT